MYYIKLQIIIIIITIFTNSSFVTTNYTNDFKPISNESVSVIDLYLNQTKTNPSDKLIHHLEYEFFKYLKLFLQTETIKVSNGVELQKVKEIDNQIDTSNNQEDELINDIINFAKNQVVSIKLNQVVGDFKVRADSLRNGVDSVERSTGKLFGGKSSFLTGFGLGFLAFGLKKLMLPFFIGAQIIKSILIAMFLPSILGSVGKLVGKGVTTFAQGSNLSGGHGAAGGAGQMEDFDFKDNTYDSQHYADSATDGSSPVFSYALPGSQQYDNSYSKYPIGVLPAPDYGAQSHTSSIANRYTPSSHRVNYIPNKNHHGSFYTKNGVKRHQDFKVFHNIPSSSLLLTNYDPFYSPLLSRIDSVFSQLGYETEACRERLVCLMYRNPAKFAPYSNLISAQLSRELNELRKPSTDNPDILRFFKYMKAAKDGQDDLECSRMYTGCYDNRESVNPPMVKTYNDINKLVQARKLWR